MFARVGCTPEFVPGGCVAGGFVAGGRVVTGCVAGGFVAVVVLLTLIREALSIMNVVP